MQPISGFKRVINVKQSLEVLADQRPGPEHLRLRERGGHAKGPRKKTKNASLLPPAHVHICPEDEAHLTRPSVFGQFLYTTKLRMGSQEGFCRR